MKPEKITNALKENGVFKDEEKLEKKELLEADETLELLQATKLEDFSSAILGLIDKETAPEISKKLLEIDCILCEADSQDPTWSSECVRRAIKALFNVIKDPVR